MLCSLRKCGCLELKGHMKKDMGKRITAPVKILSSDLILI